MKPRKALFFIHTIAQKKQPYYIWHMKYRHEQLSVDLHNKLGLHLKGNTLEIGAKKLGFSKATLSRVINGCTPDLLNYAKICKFLNKPMNTYIK